MKKGVVRTYSLQDVRVKFQMFNLTIQIYEKNPFGGHQFKILPFPR